MRTRLLILIVAVVCAAGILAATFTAPVLPKSQPFNLSRSLPTGTTYFNGMPNCGPNETIGEDFPSNGIVSYRIVQNETDASVNIGRVSVSGASFSSSFLSTGYGAAQGTFSSGEYSFVFKACGPMATVSLGFWGVTNYSAPLL